jgi:hypothetical protein
MALMRIFAPSGTDFKGRGLSMVRPMIFTGL